MMSAMKLYPGFLMTVAAALLGAGSLAAQRPVPQVAVPSDQQESQADRPQGGIQTKPLTPLEEREKQIQQYDQRAPLVRQPLPGDDLDSPTAGKTPGDPRKSKEEEKPLPGSVAASNRRQD